MDFLLGETLVFDVSFEYEGPEYNDAKLRCSIGRDILGVFDENLYAEIPLYLPETLGWAVIEKTISFVLGDPLIVANGYEIETKVYEGGAIHLFNHQDNVIDILPAEGEFNNLSVSISKG